MTHDVDVRGKFRLLFRQALFFITTVVLPSGLLVALTLRMVVQDGELADKRLADERRLFAADVRQELLAGVERIRLTAMSPSGVPAAAPQEPEIALIARVENGRLVLPWDDDPRTLSAREALEQPHFRDAIATGEQYEFAAGRLDEAGQLVCCAVEWSNDGKSIFYVRTMTGGSEHVRS